MGRGRKDVVGDPLHVVAGVQDDRPGRSVESDPAPIGPIQDLEPSICGAGTRVKRSTSSCPSSRAAPDASSSGRTGG